MTNEQQSPTATVPDAPELSAPEGARNAEVKASTPETSQTAASQGDGAIPKELQIINEATGRSYKTLEEAQKGLKETVSYVGTLGQRASLVEKLAKKIAKENNVSEDAALQYVQSLAEAEAAQAEAQQASEEPAQAAPANTARTPQDYHVQGLQEQLQELQLLRKFPEAEANMNLIKSVAKATGRDFAEIYEKDIKPLVLAGKNQAYESQSAKEGASVVVSSKEAVEPDAYASTFKAFQKGKASLRDVLRAKGLLVTPKN